MCYCYQIICFDRFGYLRDVLNHYIMDGDAQRAYDDLVSGNWAKTFLMGKNKKQILAFKEHVSIHCTLYIMIMGVHEHNLCTALL